MPKKIKEYLKTVEDENLRLDNCNDKLQVDVFKLTRELESLKQVNKEFENCLSLIADKFGWKDPEITKIITKTLNETTKKLLKK